MDFLVIRESEVVSFGACVFIYEKGISSDTKTKQVPGPCECNFSKNRFKKER